ncbi:hypothetical protein HYR99_15615 [Candidatus Poribacteria bacterium]|nr:hypothetical protein [Candidatus Poribacteria bacterium]
MEAIDKTEEGSAIAPPMDRQQFQRIKTAFERHGGSIIQDESAQEYLDFAGAEAATLDSQTILLRPQPTASQVFEELIHTSQMKRGKITSQKATRINAEIEAAEKLLRNQRAYQLSAIEIQQTAKRLENLKRNIETLELP